MIRHLLNKFIILKTTAGGANKNVIVQPVSSGSSAQYKKMKLSTLGRHLIEVIIQTYLNLYFEVMKLMKQFNHNLSYVEKF